jgi:hypothetical protein
MSQLQIFLGRLSRLLQSNPCFRTNFRKFMNQLLTLLNSLPRRWLTDLPLMGSPIRDCLPMDVVCTVGKPGSNSGAICLEAARSFRSGFG